MKQKEMCDIQSVKETNTSDLNPYEKFGNAHT